MRADLRAFIEANLRRGLGVSSSLKLQYGRDLSLGETPIGQRFGGAVFPTARR